MTHTPICPIPAVLDSVRDLAPAVTEKRDGTPREAPRGVRLSPARIFTAAEIARALGGITKQAVLARLKGIPSDDAKDVRGQRAQAWRVESLPPALFSELEARCSLPDGTRRFRTVGDLIANIPAGRIVLTEDFPEDALKLAELKVQVLAPLLARRARTGAPLAVVARHASGGFAATMPGRKPSLRTIEEWARVAERRDNGRCAFDRAALYLPETPPVAGEGIEADAFLFPSLEAFIQECAIPLPMAQQPLLWHAAFADFESAVADGLHEAATRRAAIERLAHPASPLYPQTAKALLRAWSAKFPLWADGGRTPDALADLRRTNAGRPEKFSLTRAEKLALRRHRLEKGSVANAILFFLGDPACTPATRALILAVNDDAAKNGCRTQWPKSICRAAHVSMEEEAEHRGPKARQGVETSDRRGNFWVVEDGAKRPFAPNIIWESDDMSSNEPCRFVDPETGITRGGRQILFTMDVHSAAWLGCTALGRERDAYRVEDIADHMLALVDVHGLPLAWRLERGVWESKFTDGIDVSDLTGRADETWGGLAPFIHLVRAFKSKSKGTIEGSFNHLQNLIAHASTSIGRFRGEFEEGTRLMLAAQRATALAEKHRTPEAIASAAAAWLPFWAMDSMGDAYAQACALFNQQAKKRRMHGNKHCVPEDLHRTAESKKCPDSERWRFLPVKRKATVKNGAVEFQVEHYPMPFRFRVNGGTEGVFLESGHRVLVAFHPGHPDQGCHIFNGELGSLNRDGLRFGELILIAPMAEDAPQFSMSRSEQETFAFRRRAAAAVRSEFRAIMPAGRTPVSPSASPRTSTARDGRGNSVVSGGNPARGAQLPSRNRESTQGDALIAGAMQSRREVDYDALAVQLAAEENERARHELPV